MSDYSIIVDYAAKDALTTGDTNKLISGTQITAELEAISTAIASKADATDAALSGTVSGTYTIDAGTY